VTKTGVAGTVTKYIRVSHSSNGTTFGTASNILTVIFANSGGSGGSGGDGGPCFAGDTLVTLTEDAALPFAEIYARRLEFEGITIKSFDEQGNVVDAVIEKVFRHKVYDVIEVMLRNAREFTVTPEHPFFMNDLQFVAIGKLDVGDPVMFNVGQDWNAVPIVSMDRIHLPHGIDVYNMRTSTGHYIANGCAVHNLKDIEL
jgi:hypothetical protein